MNPFQINNTQMQIVQIQDNTTIKNIRIVKSSKSLQQQLSSNSIKLPTIHDFREKYGLSKDIQDDLKRPFIKKKKCFIEQPIKIASLPLLFSSNHIKLTSINEFRQQYPSILKNFPLIEFPKKVPSLPHLNSKSKNTISFGKANTQNNANYDQIIYQLQQLNLSLTTVLGKLYTVDGHIIQTNKYLSDKIDLLNHNLLQRHYTLDYKIEQVNQEIQVINDKINSLQRWNLEQLGVREKPPTNLTQILSVRDNNQIKKWKQ